MMAWSCDSIERPEVEFWFDFASPYSYLSVMRIEDEARRHGVRIVWKPFLLGPIFRELGFAQPPMIAEKRKAAYMHQDLARQCGRHALAPWVAPSVLPRRSVLAARVALLGANRSWIAAFCRAVMALNFVRDEEIDTPEQLTPLLAALGLPAADLLALAESPSIRALLRRQTEEANARGLFGAPTFLVEDEMFWGNDRLEEAFQFARQRARLSLGVA
jgi:2-hydroxychromene-2-carboxylate isomerase